MSLINGQSPPESRERAAGWLWVERENGELTFRRPKEADVEFLHVIIDESDFVVRHEPVHNNQSAVVRLEGVTMGGDGGAGGGTQHVAYIFMTSVSILLLGELYRRAMRYHNVSIVLLWLLQCRSPSCVCSLSP